MTQKADLVLSRREMFGRSSRAWWRSVISGQEIGVFAVLMAMVFYLMYKTTTFTSPNNLQNVWLSFSWIAIAAFGETMVIITGGIDLSAGSVMALSGLASAYFICGEINGEATSWMIEKTINGRVQEMGPDKYVPLALLFGCGMGLTAGLINGLLVAWGNLPPFIATLGTMSIARGLCYGWTKGWPFRNINNNFLKIGQEEIELLGYNVPYPTIIMIVLAVIMTIFLSRMIWGYRIYAVGGNEQAAQLSGINTRRVKILAFALSGLMAGIGGTLMTARLGVAAPTAAQGYELDVIAAVFIGGASVSGGKGTIVGTLIGAATMQVLRNGLNLLGYDPYWQPAAIGLVIILAIMFDRARVQLQGGRLYLLLNFETLPAGADKSQIGRRHPVVLAFMALAGAALVFLAIRVFFLFGTLLDLVSVDWITTSGSRLWFPILIALIGLIYLGVNIRGLWFMKRLAWVMSATTILFSILVVVFTYLNEGPTAVIGGVVAIAILVLFMGWFWLNRWRFVQ